MKQDSKAVLLSTAYLPPIEYVCKFIEYNELWIEANEHYTKQSYRNRCSILGANGPEYLVIPVVKGNSKHAIKDTLISYDTAWQHNHWNAIMSAYNSTPFFEVLRDDFAKFYSKKYKYLLDYNQEITECILDILELNIAIHRTKSFEEFSPGDNFREAIHPKKDNTKSASSFKPINYKQAFSSKLDFVPNLSIIDLLFNCGSASFETLLRSIPNGIEMYRNNNEGVQKRVSSQI